MGHFPHALDMFPKKVFFLYFVCLPFEDVVQAYLLDRLICYYYRVRVLYMLFKENVFQLSQNHIEKIIVVENERCRGLTYNVTKHLS